MEGSEEEKNRGTNRVKFGIDEYIVFDDKRNEIRMEIPMTELFDPEKNKKLGKKKTEYVYDPNLQQYVRRAV